MLKCDAVFEGGGVRGIGLVGAVAAVEKAGYEFENMAGTSAGAIVAALLAAGYSASELRVILEDLDYRQFKDRNAPEWLGLLGELASVLLKYSVYIGDYFEEWFSGMLKMRGVSTFGDIRTGHKQPKYRYKFQAIASDLTDRRMTVLPFDLERYGYDPDQFPIARAVRMSISIPLFFKPVTLTDARGVVHHIVDGGLLSNYPIWLLDDNTPHPPWPTFGFKLVDSPERDLSAATETRPIRNIMQYVMAIIETLLDGHDNYQVSVIHGDHERTIAIPTVVQIGGKPKRVRTTHFDISREESRALYLNGKKTAEAFLCTWDFDAWKKRYRSGA